MTDYGIEFVATFCHRCGEPFTIDDNEIATHNGNGLDDIDHDADADHVPYSLETHRP